MTSAELGVAQERPEERSKARPDLCTQLQDYTVLVFCLISRVGLLSPPRVHEGQEGAGAGSSLGAHSAAPCIPSSATGLWLAYSHGMGDKAF